MYIINNYNHFTPRMANCQKYLTFPKVLKKKIAPRVMPKISFHLNGHTTEFHQQIFNLEHEVIINTSVVNLLVCVIDLY